MRRFRARFAAAVVVIVSITCGATIASLITYCNPSCQIGGAYNSATRNFIVDHWSVSCSSGDNNLCGDLSMMLTLYKWDPYTQGYDIRIASFCHDIPLQCGGLSSTESFDLTGWGTSGARYEAFITVWTTSCANGMGSIIDSWLSSPFTY